MSNPFTQNLHVLITLEDTGKKYQAETSQTTHPKIHRHITRDMNPRQLRRNNIKSHKIIRWLVEMHRAFVVYGIGIILIYFNHQQVT